MKNTYYCVKCGEEIRPDQIAQKTMVSLSHAALDGANPSTIDRFPVYITREELEKLVNRTDENGRQYLLLNEYLEFAYNKVNQEYLFLDETERVRDAKAAFEIYHERLRESEEEAQSDIEKIDETEQEILIPGFNETASAQIIKNFPNDVCYLVWRIDDINGYLYRLIEKPGALDGITPFWVCASCKEEILGCAYNDRHILIGLLGFPSAGKTCLIAALCETLMKQGGILTLPKHHQLLYEDLLADYRGGYTLAKTDALGVNTLRPSIRKDHVLWTFVDIPGEMFYTQINAGMDRRTLVRDKKMQMSLKCHAYILTADQEIAFDENTKSRVLDTFEQYLNFAEEFNTHVKKGMPLAFTLTKVDEIKDGESKQNLPSSCITDNYPRRYQKELSILRNKSIGSLLDTLSSNNYLFASTCAPYGFKPLDADNPDRSYFPTRDHKKVWIENYLLNHPEILEENVPHPIYKETDPKSVDIIMEWLEKLFGIKAIPYDVENGREERQDLSQISILDGHFDDVTASMITCMFCNPSASDANWFFAIDEGMLLKKRRQEKIKREFLKSQQKGKAK